MSIDEPFANAEDELLANVYQLPKRQRTQVRRPRSGSVVSPASFERVVNDCIDKLGASAPLGDLMAKVFDTILAGSYEDRVDRAFRDAIAAVAATRERR